MTHAPLVSPGRLTCAPWRGASRPAALVLGAAVLAVFGHTVSFGFLLQDEWAILDNPVFRSAHGIVRVLSSLLGAEHARGEVPIATEPLVLASQLADRALFGTRPWAFRLHALLLHVLVALALFHFVRSRAHRLLSRRTTVATPLDDGHVIGFALFTACVFAVHPLVVEPVAGIAYRGTLQGALLQLAGLALVERARAPSSRGPTALRMLALLLVAAAGFANPAALVAPLLLFTCDLFARPWTNERLGSYARDWALWSAAAAAPVLWRHWALAGRSAWPAHLLDPGNTPAAGTRFLQGLWGLWAALAKLFLPVGLLAEYPERYFDGSFERMVAALMVAGLPALFVLAFCLRRHVPMGALGLSLGVVAHLPVVLPSLGPTPTWPAQADRYAYLPLAFWIPAVLACMAALFKALVPRLWPLAYLSVRLARRATLGVPLVALLASLPVAVLAVTAHERARVWSHDARLWDDAIEAAPFAARLRSKRAFAALADNDLRVASTMAAAAITLGRGADAYWALGRAEMRRGALTHACEALNIARGRAAEADRPRVDLLVDLAHCLTRSARPEPALALTREASHRAPWFERAYLQEAETLKALGRSEEAEQVLRALEWLEIRD